MPLSGIPVQLFNTIVGEAEIDDDGGITIQTNSPLLFGEDLASRINAGVVVGLAISPVGVPVQDDPEVPSIPPGPGSEGSTP